MSEQEFIQEGDKIAQEKAIERKLGKFLKENQGSAFTITAINNRLEDILKNTNDLEYAKENLRWILNKMGNNGIIDTVKDGGETHYLIKETEEKTLEERKIRLKLMNWINDNRGRITGWLLLLGVLVGTLIAHQANLSEMLIAFVVIFVAVPSLGEIIVRSKQSKENLKYYPPIFGIVTLVISVIGLILLTLLIPDNFYYPLNWGSLEGLESLYATPLIVVAIISGLAGFYFDKDNKPYVAMVGLFLGGILLIISLMSILYYALGFLALLFGLIAALSG